MLGNDLAGQLEQHRPYLKLLARLYLDRQCQAKVDASDVVQQSFLEAQRSLDLFHGRTGAEFAAWLRKILACQVARCMRDLHRDKRNVDREQSLQDAMDKSSGQMAEVLVAAESSPSERAQKNEWAVRVAAVLDTISEDQREALISGITIRASPLASWLMHGKDAGGSGGIARTFGEAGGRLGSNKLN